ncbi:BRO1-like domain-containing protein [Pisolithus croceorrhizus]|nr:BRO1-like domain-containing protein [Pisolithus croceorrhizus]
MSHQLPMISIPKKTTDEVDWTTPIRHLIAKSYGENPDNYIQECQALQRCRQDAVKGAGSDTTGRDLLYKYFGQLELLELRFSEIRVNFSWHDAFTNKVTTQTSIAFEKASILFQIAATHSAIAASQSRFEPEGIKLAFHYFRACAGMLTYVNENFLHAPSTDLSREVIKFLVGIILAQATEVFLEKCIDEKKANALVSKIASQAASMYTSLNEEVKDFQGKGIIDRNWVTVIQIKSKLFASLAQCYRAQADMKAGNHGEALARWILAESLAKEAHHSASSFSALFSHVSSTLPADAGPSILDRTKSHSQFCTERKNEVQRENDLIYNAVVPSAEVLPPIEKASVATPIPIQEVYGSPDVQKVIAFTRVLACIQKRRLSLSARKWRTRKSAEVEVRSALEATGVQDGLARFKGMVDEDIGIIEDRESVDTLMRELARLKENVRGELEDTSRELEAESHECEAMRIKYDHLWTQEPSAGLNKALRQDLKSHMAALDAAATSDQQVVALWDSVKGDISLLLSPGVEEPAGPSQSLLEVDVGYDEQERTRIRQFTSEIEERLGRLKKISYERGEVLKDLKEKIQADDVSHLLLLHRRNTGVEPALFAAELEKFRPYQQRLAATVHHQQVAIQEIQSLWKGLRDLAGRGPGVKEWEEQERLKKDMVRRFSRARDGYMDVRDGIMKGLQFYKQLMELAASLARNVKSFTSERRVERERLIGHAEVQQRLSVPKQPLPPVDSKPPLPPQPHSRPSLEASFASMNLQTGRHATPPPPKPPQVPQPSSYAVSPPAPQPQRLSTHGFPPPPPQLTRSTYVPPPPAQDPYASLGLFTSPQSNSPAVRQPSAPPPPPSQKPPSQPSHSYTKQGYSGSSTFPAPPPPPPGVGTRISSQHQPISPPAPQGYNNQYKYGYGR